MLRVMVLLFGLILAPVTTLADIAPGPTWQEQVGDDGNTYATSPPDEFGQYVILISGPSDPWPADFNTFYAQQTAALVTSVGTVVARSGLQKLGDSPAAGTGELWREVITLQPPDGQRMVFAIYAYGVGQNLQTLLIAAPDILGLDSPPALEADGKIRALWREAYLEPAAAAAPVPTDPQPGTAVAAPGAVGEGAVEAVVIGSAVKSGGLFITEQVPFLLLKDGRSYQEEGASPLDFDPNNRPRDSFEPGRWQATASGWKIDYPDGSFYEIDASGRMQPAPAGFQLSGVYVARGGAFGRIWSERLVFGADGSVSGGQAGSVSGQSGFGGEFEGSGANSSAGNYQIGGWTITMPDAGGRPKRFLFAMTGGAAPRTICIGFTLYVRE